MKKKLWGWGVDGVGPKRNAFDATTSAVWALFGDDRPPGRTAPKIQDIDLRPARLRPPDSLTDFVSWDKADRAGHHYGQSYTDLINGISGHYPHPPDLVARPASGRQIVELLDWCSSGAVAVIPYGGGTSVVGGIEPDVGDDFSGSISVDLTAMNEVLEVDEVSRAARIQAGIMGPALEQALGRHDLTLRHFPQSFEFSTLGGWIATRSAGSIATLTTRIDDMVESLRMVTPVGVMETRRLPSSGAGPSPERWLLGSEGALGIITEAWMRLQARPRFKARASVEFPGPSGFPHGVEAMRALAQSGLYPTGCRLLDRLEANLTGVASEPLMLLGFDSADHPVEDRMARALEIAREAKGVIRDPPGGSEESRTDRWKDAFRSGPYLRDALVLSGLVVETFETAMTWDRLEDAHTSVIERTRSAVSEVCGQGFVTSRLTHVYPDGVAAYYTVVAPATPGSEIAQWRAIKDAASETILAKGGTITHHHAVGRHHHSRYEQERSHLFAEAIMAVKSSWDPKGILNPGVLLSVTGRDGPIGANRR